MKKLFTLWLLALLLPISIFAQDTPAPAADMIIKRNGDEIPARVDEVGLELIRYHRADNLQGPLFSIPRSEVFMIRYANGTRDVFNYPNGTTQPAQPPVPALPPPPPVAAPAPPPPSPHDSVFTPILAEGPRIGVTVIGTGRLRDKLREDYNATHVISMLGWQFETRIFQLPNGPSGLFEFVPMIGGLEQGLFMPSVSGILGLRGRTGLELGFGPNLSLAGAGLVIAAGHTAQGKYINVPVNVAVVPSGKGARYSLLIGFTYHRPNSVKRY